MHSRINEKKNLVYFQIFKEVQHEYTLHKMKTKTLLTSK